jgi:hypothetical protein
MQIYFIFAQSFKFCFVLYFQQDEFFHPNTNFQIYPQLFSLTTFYFQQYFYSQIYHSTIFFLLTFYFE